MIANTTGGAWSDPTYDLVGNTTRTPSLEAPTDASKDRQLTYDAWNRVVKVTDSDTTFADPNKVAFYEYDARGFRIINQAYGSTGAGVLDDTLYVANLAMFCMRCVPKCVLV
ncbi:MAG: hypothetical protein AAGB26_05380 [Planctomycetota bacterium]